RSSSPTTSPMRRPPPARRTDRWRSASRTGAPTLKGGGGVPAPGTGGNPRGLRPRGGGPGRGGGLGRGGEVSAHAQEYGALPARSGAGSAGDAALPPTRHDAR